MTLALTILIISAACFFEAVFGFGGGLISVPLLSLILGVKEAVTLILIFQLLLGLLILHTYKVTQWTVIKPALAALLLGAAIGTLSLAYFIEATLRLILASAIILYLLKQLLLRNAAPRKTSPTLLGILECHSDKAHVDA